MHGLILLQMVLAGEDVTGVDVENLADVPVGVGPDQLMTPGLLDPEGDFGHQRSTG
jgi:hypothetical protein